MKTIRLNYKAGNFPSGVFSALILRSLFVSPRVPLLVYSELHAGELCEMFFLGGRAYT